MSGQKLVTRNLEMNYRVIQAQVKGLSHADTLLQPAARGNCLNWVLGHVTESRRSMMMVAGLAPLWEADRYARYQRESDPVMAEDDVLPIEELLADLEATQARLVGALPELPDEKWDAVADDRGRTTGERLNFLVWHEAYHAGQMEQLRQLAGTDDKVI